MKKIKDFLKSKDMYQSIDDMLISRLEFNINLAEDCENDINENEPVVKTAAGGVKINPSITVYNAALKNIEVLLTKLGITPQERAKLKITNEKVDPLEVFN